MLKILIVEDQTQYRNQIKNALQKKGLDIHISETNTGEEALKMLQNEDFSIVLLDFHLDGEKTGQDVLNFINSLQKPSQVIAITGTPGKLPTVKLRHNKLFERNWAQNVSDTVSKLISSDTIDI